MKKVQIVVADVVAVAGVASFGYGMYITLGAGPCFIAVGALLSGLGVFLDRGARQ